TRLGRADAAAAVLAVREAVARQAGDRRAVADTLVPRAALAGTPTGDPGRGLGGAGSRSRAAARPGGPSRDHRARALPLRWAGAGRGGEALEELSRQEGAWRAAGHLSGLQRCLGNRAVVLGDRGRVAEALALHAQEERICRQLRDHRGACVSLANQARLLRDA